MTHREAVSFIACLPGVPQEVVDALEDGFAAVEHALSASIRDAATLRIDMRLREGELNLARRRIDDMRAAAADPLPF
jgi:hypothetical protein